MKPFSTYPEDRARLLELAAKATLSDDAAAIELGDMVSAILNDEEVSLHQVDETVALLRDAYAVLAFAFNRIHGLPRSRDTELAGDIGKVRARIETVLKFYDRPTAA